MSTGRNPKVERCGRSLALAIGKVPNRQLLAIRDVAACSKDLVTQSWV